MALHDPLTGLPNRRALAQEIETLAETQAGLTLLWHDLDGFKDVNDLYGHAAGDAILKEVRERLSDALPGIFVARVGGDEFVALLADADVDETRCAIAAVLGAFDDPFIVDSCQICLGVSVGCAGLGGATLSADELMRRADAAMYAAKSQGKGCWRAFDASMDEAHQFRMAMEKDLADAIRTGKIEVVYQPIVDANTHKVVSVEALARWTHPIHGVISPEVFIPLAEQVGMINALGRHVLREACRACAGLSVRLSVNLSPAEFWDQNLVRDISLILSEARFPADRLQLEITEGYLLRQPHAAAEVLNQLRNSGVTVALDDFGTGFASIGYLRQLPFDRLKIDKEFVRPLGNGGAGLDLICAIGALAASLGLEITAEGVETHEQAAMARIAGCSQLQGWLFGRPMPMPDLLGRLASNGVLREYAAA